MSDLQRIALLLGVLMLLVFVWLRWDPSDYGRPPLGYVTGKVSLDGKPLAGVIIAFYPENGRMGTAIVDKDGSYDVKYTNRVRGTKIGPSTVHFAWQTGDSGPTIPERYGDRSELKVDVQKKKNVFNFDLVSTPPEETPAQPPKRQRNVSRAKPRPNAAPVLD
jgi:hypothetical protein